MHNIAFQIATQPEAPIQKQSAGNPQIDSAKLSKIIYAATFTALDGPSGVNPTDMIAALGALAGYSARWLVLRQIADGKLQNDFAEPKGTNMPFISVSNHVNEMVIDLTKDSFAGILTKSMMAAGANWLPNANADVNHNFVAINCPDFPDYTIDKQYWPQIPPQALLLMMWETQARILAHTPGAEDVAVQAYALAITRAAADFKQDLPMDQAAQIALETAIAMAKINYAF